MKETKLHLGCGKRYIPGYIHIDIDTHPHIDHNHDIRTLPMFNDNTVDLIYSCGTFAYFDREDAPTVLKEWRRVLKPGGILRTAVTDFEALIEVYLRSGRDLDSRGILGPLFGRWPVEAPDGKFYIYQRTVYDFNSIRKKFESEGFINVRRYDWRKVMPPGYDDYSMAYIPHMDQKNGILISLNVECEKA